MDTPIIFGEISGLFGIQGEVRVFDFSRNRGDILNFDSWMIEQGTCWQEITVRQGRHHRGALVVKLDGFDDRDISRQLLGAKIGIKREQLPDLVDGEYYWHQLEGLLVVDIRGEELGIVDKLMETGANDVLVVRGSHEHLIPYTKSTIADVDLSSQRIRVDWEIDY